MIYTVNSTDDILDRLRENDGLIVNGEKQFLYRQINGKLEKIQVPRTPIRGMNAEHHIFASTMGDKRVKMINLRGCAGTGKTYMSLGLALNAIFREEFSKVIIVRELVPATRFSAGFLPGNMAEKITPMFGAIYDTVHALTGTDLFKQRGDAHEIVSGLIQSKKVEFTTLETLRGRNFDDAIILADDAQNLDINNVKLLVTRLANNTKIILNGDDMDESQTDNWKMRGKGMDYLHKVCHGMDEYAEIIFTHSECRSKTLAKFLKREKEYLENLEQ